MRACPLSKFTFCAFFLNKLFAPGDHTTPYSESGPDRSNMFSGNNSGKTTKCNHNWCDKKSFV